MMLNRPHRLYLLLGVTWLAIILIVRPDKWWTMAALSMIVGVILAFYFQYSSRLYATRLLARVAAGEPNAERLYLNRTRSRFGDVAKEYVTALLASEDERVLPLVVKQLCHPDAQAREMAEDRLVRWGGRAAEPLVQAAVGTDLAGDGAFRARRLLWRMKNELPGRLTALLESAGYWKE